MKNFIFLSVWACLLLITLCILSSRTSAQTADAKIPHAAIGSLSLNTNTQWLDDYFDKKITDSVQIVGLGEVSHGGIEPMDFQIKMIQYLVEKRGYRNVLIEYPDLELIRPIRYYLNIDRFKDSIIERLVEKGKFTHAISHKLIKAFKWLKQFNLIHPNDKVQVAGFDLSTSPAFINYILNNYITPLNAAEGAIYARTLNGLTDNELKVRAIKTWFKNSQILLQKKLKSTEFERLKFYFDDFEQGIKSSLLRNTNFDKHLLYRDSIMAQNVRYFTGSGKSVLIAHNAHISRSGNVLMGTLLDKYYHSRYYVLVTDFSKQATVEIARENIADTDTAHYFIQSFSPYSTTAPVEILQKFNLTSGMFQHRDIINFRLLDRTNIIDLKGFQCFSPAHKNAFDSLVVFENITSGKD